ncbi:MAG: RDD family protein, partial [Lysobacter sp.]
PWLEAPAQILVAQLRALVLLSGQTVGAAIVDGASLVQLPTTLLDAPAVRTAITTVHVALWSLAWRVLLAFALLGAGYHVACECSPWQGSVGKRLLGLRVCDQRGRRLDAGRALLRYLAAALSWATLNVGHLMAANPPTHRALHDRCSGTQVVARTVGLPGWARLWLGAIALAGLAAAGGFANRAGATMSAALERAMY